MDLRKERRVDYRENERDEFGFEMRKGQLLASWPLIGGMDGTSYTTLSASSLFAS
jgi:hypothetical protein